MRSNYFGEKLDYQLDKLYRSYYVNNQEKIVKNINKMFKVNNFDLKLYIL